MYWLTLAYTYGICILVHRAEGMQSHVFPGTEGLDTFGAEVRILNFTYNVVHHQVGHPTESV
jgi:hypothetical protein